MEDHTIPCFICGNLGRLEIEGESRVDDAITLSQALCNDCGTLVASEIMTLLPGKDLAALHARAEHELNERIAVVR